YCSVDYTILGQTGEGSILPLLESMACGVPCLFGLGAAAESFLASASGPGRGGPRLVRDNGTCAFNTADQQEPVVDFLVARLDESYRFSVRDRTVLANEAAYSVRGQSTLRHTV